VIRQRRDSDASQLHSPSGTRCEVYGRDYLGSYPVLVYRVSECGVQILSRDRSTRAIHKALTTFDQGSCAPALGQRTAFTWGCKSPVPAPFNARTPGLARSALCDFWVCNFVTTLRLVCFVTCHVGRGSDGVWVSRYVAMGVCAVYLLFVRIRRVLCWAWSEEEVGG
jgi:hypothetical protein